MLRGVRVALPEWMRRSAEMATGESLGGVRIQLGALPALFGARAFCTGEDVWMLPGTDARVLAHELAHVVQFRMGRVRGRGSEVLLRDAAIEEEAEWLAVRMLAGRRTRLGTAASEPARAMLPFTDNPPGYPGFRLSESGDMAIVHFWTGEKRLYATVELVDAANRALSQVHSMVSLRTVDVDYRYMREKHLERGKTLVRVLPRWNPVTAPPHDHHMDLNAKNTDPNEYYTWSDCHRTSQTVMGARKFQADVELIRPMVVLEANRLDVLPPFESAPECRSEFPAVGATTEIASRGAYSAMQAIRRQNEPDVPPQVSGTMIVARWREHMVLCMGPAGNLREYEASHELNHFIQPRVGEGIAILPARVDARFTSSYAWEDLKQRVDRDLLDALGLTLAEPEPPSYTLMLERLEGATLNPALTEEQRVRLCDQMLRTQALEKLRAPYCRLEEARKSELVARLQDRSRSFEDAIRDVTDSELVELLRIEAFYLGYAGDTRDGLQTSMLDGLFSAAVDRVVTSAILAHADSRVRAGGLALNEARELKKLADFMRETSPTVDNLVNDQLEMLRLVLEPARWQRLGRELTPPAPAPAPAPVVPAGAAPGGVPTLTVPRRAGPPPPPVRGALPAGRATRDAVDRLQSLTRLRELTPLYFAGPYDTRVKDDRGGMSPVYSLLDSRRDKPAYATAFRRELYIQFGGFPGGAPPRDTQNWVRVFRSLAPRTFKNAWNFHWAGVVLADGNDFVTLENLSVQNKEYPNQNWYFEMYQRMVTPADGEDPEKLKRTFHGQMMATGGFGNVGLTLAYRAFLPPPRIAAPRVENGSGIRTTIEVTGVTGSSAAAAAATPKASEGVQPRREG